MQLFFLSDLTADHFEFSEEESKHCIRVLRKKRGDKISLIDGKGCEAVGLIESDNPKKCIGAILSRKTFPINRKYFLHLAIAPTKNFDRMEFMLEKIIEMGIDEITFLVTEKGERSKVNQERCEKIAISAIKQSKQHHLPLTHNLTPLTDFLQKDHSAYAKFMAWCPVEKESNLSTLVGTQLPPKSIVLIGPEGDFTPEEADLAQAKGFTPVSLGPNILRSETAGIFVSGLFATHFQNN